MKFRQGATLLAGSLYCCPQMARLNSWIASRKEDFNRQYKVSAHISNRSKIANHRGNISRANYDQHFLNVDTRLFQLIMLDCLWSGVSLNTARLSQVTYFMSITIVFPVSGRPSQRARFCWVNEDLSWSDIITIRRSLTLRLLISYIYIWSS